MLFLSLFELPRRGFSVDVLSIPDSIAYMLPSLNSSSHGRDTVSLGEMVSLLCSDGFMYFSGLHLRRPVLHRMKRMRPPMTAITKAKTTRIMTTGSIASVASVKGKGKTRSHVLVTCCSYACHMLVT